MLLYVVRRNGPLIDEIDRPNRQRAATPPAPDQAGKLTPTPAMRAGLVDALWFIEDLYAAVMKQQAEKKQRERVEKLLRKLRGLD